MPLRGSTGARDSIIIGVRVGNTYRCLKLYLLAKVVFFDYE
jgi:hypothetical protein